MTEDLYFNVELRRLLDAIGLSDCGENDEWTFWYQRLHRAHDATVDRVTDVQRIENAKLREKIKALTELASIGKLTASQCTELAEDNAKLRKLVCDMLPFAEVGMDDTCVARRCCLFEQCECIVGVTCAIEQHMLDRMRELGIEVD